MRAVSIAGLLLALTPSCKKPEKPIDKRQNTWAVRYGDPEWKSFLDFYGRFLTINGEVDRLLKFHVEKLGGA